MTDSEKYRSAMKRSGIMFWLGCVLGYIVGSVITCALLYFGFRTQENKKVDNIKEE
ncbi:hypothetical protein [Bacillus sp. 1A]|uniref:hypothetical protein n=1 Tax=Bacillus sp. 1A TaxID=3461399 RepID=UPI0040446FEE